ncbi:MAG: transglutaminase domain-containing protein, partial [Myxococcales bacterium]|nr:transglutaminase domain-containing protein [Myxococcales bacterium]
RDRARALTEGATPSQARIDRIYRLVSQEIRYHQDHEDTFAGVRPHSCPVVLERGYGDCKDKAVLMILLARELGIDLRFAILRTSGAGAVRREVPNQQFNHAIVYVPAQDGIDEGYFVDPTTDGLDMGNLRADDQGATALVLDPGSGEWAFHDIAWQPADITYYRCDIDVSVTGEEAASAATDCRIRGTVASMFRRAMRNEERADQVRQNVAHAMFAGASVTESETEHLDDIVEPIRMRMGLNASSALVAHGSEHRMRVPAPFALGSLTRLERRRTPLRLGVLDSSRWAVTFEAPRTGRITRVPEDFTIEHDCFRVARRSQLRGRTATVTVEYSRSCPEIAPEAYPEFRRQAQRAATLLQDEVVFDL